MANAAGLVACAEWMFTCVLGLVAASCVVPDPEPRHAAYEDVRRVVALLDDIAAEYPRSVDDHAITSPSRMKVIETMLHDAQLFGSRFADDERTALAEIESAVKRLTDPPAVVQRARGLRRSLMAGYGLVLAPPGPLDRARAVQQWEMLCAGCHGIAGMGDGPQGLGLDPEPKDFHEWAFMAELAPSRAFSQIADGVRATAMPQWGLFSTRERWGLAFLVFGFRYDAGAIERGRAVLGRQWAPSSISAVADLTDRQLVDQLRGRGFDESSAMDALAYLRGAVPFEPPTGRLAEVRLRLGELATQYPARGVEPARLLDAARQRLRASLEAIRAAAPVTAARLERRLAELDHALATDVMNEVMERSIARVGPALDDAEQALREPDTRGTLRLACEWALAASLGLGLVMGTRRRATAGASPTVAAVALAAAGIAAALGTDGTAFAALSLGLVAATLAAFTLPPSVEGRLPCLALAALAGAPLGALARVLLDVYGPRATMPFSIAVTALALACIAARAAAARWSRLAPAVMFVSVVIAAAGAAGRATSHLASTRYLEIARIEALGVLPSAAALAAAAIAALVAGVVMFRHVRRRDAPAHGTGHRGRRDARQL